MANRLRAAACHVCPVFLSAKDTTQKCISLIHQASRNSANLVVFPESYIPAFPHWSSLRAPSENHDFFERITKESLFIDGEEIRAIQHAAKITKTIVSLGISERVRYSSATLFNSNVIIGADGELLVHHRKLMPTFFEKLTWGHGDGYGLRVADTQYGKIGALICGENTNPLARFALIAQGEQVHISSWPAVWPTRQPKTPSTNISGVVTSSSSDGVNYDNIRANRTRAAAHCFEAKCFGILCAGYLGADAIKMISADSEDPAKMFQALDIFPRAPTMFLDPTGGPLPGFTIDPSTGHKTTREFLQLHEGVLYADMDLDDCVEGKQYHDLVGGYQRLDVFNLKIDRSRREPASFKADPS